MNTSSEIFKNKDTIPDFKALSLQHATHLVALGFQEQRITWRQGSQSLDNVRSEAITECSPTCDRLVRSLPERLQVQGQDAQISTD